MMKRTAAWILAAALLAAMLPACAENWYCPQCGRLNDGNFCPYDGTANPLRTSDEDPYEQDPFWYVYSEYAYMPAVLNSRLSTRTGPGTQYDEPGSFLKAGSEVTVLSKAYDTRNEIWWLQVSFREAGREYWAYTGLKRFTGLNIDYIPEEEIIGTCYVSGRITGYYGPDTAYEPIKRAVPAGVQCTVYGYVYREEGDFLQIEFYDDGIRCWRRAWVPEWAVDDYYMYNL